MPLNIKISLKTSVTNNLKKLTKNVEFRPVEKKWLNHDQNTASKLKMN